VFELTPFAFQQQLHERLQELAPTASDDLRAAWEEAVQATLADRPRRDIDAVPEQFLILITCGDERHQATMPERFRGEGVDSHVARRSCT
jgi:hypothetical protein